MGQGIDFALIWRSLPDLIGIAALLALLAVTMVLASTGLA